MKQRFCSTPVVDLALVSRVSTSLKDLRDQLIICFPHRENAINQLIYAIIMREHILMWGRTGTAKTALTTAAFSAFTGANTFITNLNKFSTEAHIVGIPDPNVLRDTGRVYYRPEGMILVADFAFLDEFFDASGALLRTLLNILNERTFNRGPQRETAKLLTAVATTNADPYMMVKADPSMEAVLDRLMFKVRVEDLDTEADQIAMLNSYLNGLSPDVKISLDDLKAFSEIIKGSNLITNPLYISAYLSIFNTYEKKSGVNLSDRTMAKLTQILEASALLDGRTEIIPTDLRSIRWGICDGDNIAHLTMVDEIIENQIAEVEKSLGSSADAAQLQLISTYIKDLSTISITTTSSPEDILIVARKLGEMESSLKTMTCQLATTEESRKKLMKSIEKLHQKIVKQVFGA